MSIPVTAAHSVNAQYNTKFIYIVGNTNSITLAMNSYLPTYSYIQAQHSTYNKLRWEHV